jgi:hypothetical protein
MDVQIFFNQWNDGGAHWQSEYERYFRQEDSQWTTVVNRKERKNPSYADVVRNPRPVSGANAVPLGQGSDPRSSVPRRSVFWRIGQGSDRHSSVPRRSVFQRIVWPKQSRPMYRYHQMDNPVKNWRRNSQAKNRDFQ